MNVLLFSFVSRNGIFFFFLMVECFLLGYFCLYGRDFVAAVVSLYLTFKQLHRKDSS